MRSAQDWSLGRASLVWGFPLGAALVLWHLLEFGQEDVVVIGMKFMGAFCTGLFFSMAVWIFRNRARNYAREPERRA